MESGFFQTLTCPTTEPITETGFVSLEPPTGPHPPRSFPFSPAATGAMFLGQVLDRKWKDHTTTNYTLLKKDCQVAFTLVEFLHVAAGLFEIPHYRTCNLYYIMCFVPDKC